MRLRFYLFKNVWNMISLIANKVKTNICLASVRLFVVHTILCATVFNLYNNTRNYLFVILLTSSVLISTNSCSVDLYNSDLQTTTVFFTCNITQGWLNSYALSAMSCPFIVQRKQADERSWSRQFVFSLFKELYCDFIFVCAFAYLSIRFFSCLLLVYLELFLWICVV